MSEPLAGVTVRPETNADSLAVRDAIAQAFGQTAEADLVDLLRLRGAAIISLVAVVEGRVAGHILFSPVTIDRNPLDKQILGLAPLAVLPALQRGGIGGLLIRSAFDACRHLKVEGAVVLGSPDYYPRFGFLPANHFGLSCEYPVPPEDFMAIAFTPAGLQGCSGTVHYHPAFSELDV